jgi:hypothetical protein
MCAHPCRQVYTARGKARHDIEAAEAWEPFRAGLRRQLQAELAERAVEQG